MDRNTFEVLRNLDGKAIRSSIKFARKQSLRPLLVAEDIEIENSMGIDLRLSLHYNPEVGSTTINVHVPGTGSICRLDVQGTNHKPYGRTHKHSLETERCPAQNLRRRVQAMTGLDGLPVADIFQRFCEMAKIRFLGEDLEHPDR